MVDHKSMSGVTPASIFPGLQANYSNLIPQTISTIVRLARPCIHAN